MKLYLCQHGQAVAKELDPDRPLSNKGLASLLVIGKAGKDLLAFVPGSIACLERNQTRTWKVASLLRPELVRESNVD